MTNLDFFNKKFGYKRYLWVMDFRFSRILEQYVALASENGEETILIDVFGDPVDFL